MVNGNYKGASQLIRYWLKQVICVMMKIRLKYFTLKYKQSKPGIFFIICNKLKIGTAVAQWLRCCATNREVAGSIPAGVIGIFH